MDNTENAAKQGRQLGDDDIEILQDFIMESTENLEQIEIGLIDLEQDPSDKNLINSVFRPFHTIKGVTGFLDLKKMNVLAHATENLLDAARSGEFVINDDITDVILQSVDLLKQLIKGIETAMNSGGELEGDIDVEPLIGKINAAQERAVKGESRKLGEILTDSCGVETEALDKALAIQKEHPDTRLGEILVNEKIADSKQVVTALREQRKGRRHIEHQVKVDTTKLDNLVDQVGELVISQSILRQNSAIRQINDHALIQNLNQLTLISSTIQKIAMSMRMVPIGTTFQKMVRLVRDLARNSKKKVDLQMQGEDTEIDRNVVEQLYEPMVHMIRNAVDHGLETPAQRQEAGKSENGTIDLRAYHQGGNIVIEINDDGRGLNKARILEKAKTKGLIADDAQLSDHDIFNLIFHPGFSTAQQITDVSGRGVGMDVVKKAIEKLRGNLEIQSIEGQGSTFVISLPLTLAIIDGMIVRLGEERYILPAISILECLQPRQADCHTVKGQGEMIKVRGQLLPLIRLNRVFGLNGGATRPWEGLVVVENKGKTSAILIDEILGKEEVVIKSLGETLKNIQGLAGGAILGDGRVGLILDMEGLMTLSRN